MYSEQLSSSKPGFVVILLDQSSSMDEPYENVSKADFAALTVNRTIADIIKACTSGEEIKDRCYIAVIGYGSKVDVLFLDKVSELAKVTKTTKLKKKISDGAGGLLEVDDIMRVFVSPTHSGGTPMAEAFKSAYMGVEKFIKNNPNSFPPTIINITDGEPNSMTDAAKEASNLSKLQTSDGNVIIMNAHISSATGGKVELPSNDTTFSNNQFAKFLFDISSVLPISLVNKAKDVGFNVETDARGFIYNADAETLIRLLNFGSLGLLR